MAEIRSKPAHPKTAPVMDILGVPSQEDQRDAIRILI
jgi:hypothetical protein